MNHHYCPLCFAEIPIGVENCPACGRNIEAWERQTPYYGRLIWALKNPHSEVRMGAILSLANQNHAEAAGPLAECALDYPVDVVQGMAILNAIDHLPAGTEKRQALEKLIQHPAHAVRVSAQEKLDHIL
ncbi:HEAT repeat domain-containing protein [Acidithiobacillus sulfurivorans]|uniref:HEAT repeat domain-containing protein n=1 Tax=Acidithiobacillus sulfurivorans TaxID=1958756 RepID=A0ABS6A236_9PROT|nr:HEAT repeat domain-containing protein [Acidithiobacillus sulfurivorans]MBU2761499.1 HEAT repeat domain-containing protein [Acidithiobacillus sulfurivorans]